MTITGIMQCDSTLETLAEITRQEETLVAAMDREIAKIREANAPKLDELRGKIKGMDKGVKAFMKKSGKTLFAERGTIETHHGLLKQRKTKILTVQTRRTWAEVLGNLVSAKKTEAIGIVQKVKKEVLETWPEEDLAAVGVRWQNKVAYSYELKTEGE